MKGFDQAQCQGTLGHEEFDIGVSTLVNVHYRLLVDLFLISWRETYKKCFKTWGFGKLPALVFLISRGPHWGCEMEPTLRS